MEAQALAAHYQKFKHIYTAAPKEMRVLKPETHFRLVQDMTRITAMANIPDKYVYTSMRAYCGQGEIDWLRTLKKHQMEGNTGLCFTGQTSHLEDRMMAIAGACIRNYIDARVLTTQDVIQRLKTDTMPEPRVLLIPNFFLKKDSGGDIASWQVSSLMGLLFTRFSKELHTVLYVQSLHALGEAYGPAFRTHIEEHFTVIQNAS